MGKNVILIGMPASGKSTLGVTLAKYLCYDYMDTDLVIQKKTGKKLSQLIEELGAEGFLDLEGEIIASLPDTEYGTVISTGGSAVYREAAMLRLRELGTVIYLQVDLAVLEKRIHRLEERGVVNSGGKSFSELYAERAPLYEKYSDVTVREGRQSKSEVCEVILNYLGHRM